MSDKNQTIYQLSINDDLSIELPEHLLQQLDWKDSDTLKVEVKERVLYLCKAKERRI